MIYFDDVKTCNQFTQASADNLKRSALFVLATIQQALETVPVAVTDFEELGTASRFAWGFKARGLDYLDANYQDIYRDAMAALDDPVALLQIFLRVPGFGIIKAGFLCQILAGTVGCIDRHNIKLYGVPLSALRMNYGCSDKFRLAKLERYVALCDGIGGSFLLWSRWCDYVAALRPYNWSDGAEVSRFHVDVITGREDGAIVDLFTDVSELPEFRQSA